MKTVFFINNYEEPYDIWTIEILQSKESKNIFFINIQSYLYEFNEISSYDFDNMLNLYNSVLHELFYKQEKILYSENNIYIINFYELKINYKNERIFKIIQFTLENKDYVDIYQLKTSLYFSQNTTTVVKTFPNNFDVIYITKLLKGL